jgi:hypothetical protein
VRPSEFDGLSAEAIVRCTLLILALVGGLGWCGVYADADCRGSPVAVETSWRHTKNGWQRADDWLTVDGQTASALGIFDSHRPAIPHPAIVALFLSLLSLWCLIAFTAAGSGETEPTGSQAAAGDEKCRP